MITIEKYDKKRGANVFIRRMNADPRVTASVAAIVEDVKERGDEAVREYSLKFDGWAGEMPVSESEWAEGAAKCDAFLLQVMKEAAQNIADFHRRQIPQGFEVEKENGVILGQKVTPLERVGIYVPGGTAAYPSTVLMNAVPASVAGVKEIIMVTPAKEGRIKPEILAAAKIAGVTKIFKVGGAQAIAALAYGTQTTPAVDKITGPGNIYVATAKKLVYGQVDIDMIAGPSEILVIADESADAERAAADMLSQAEHDVLASAVMVTTSARLAELVAAEIERQLTDLPRREIAQRSIEDNGRVIVTESLDDAVEIANALAPEHLEVYTSDPFALLPRLVNAGSIFLGGYTPEPVGDYFAGPNHTLPTSGTARFSSPLSGADFVKRSSYIHYTKEALKEAGEKIAAFAESEGLQAHANAVRIRR
ncbi:MAG TPA: histidinol dehydrogenase [Candidatus Caccalectryoclostridium excrementigallinarum]|uniref:Histidinol dehydrogenase n=1 Tax=Candidatus Caccalectryoclostridium excrementigallinarum TaxID=2840710 RepID=A0A9D1MMX7_9FIRM|nr:histidinol dehydrogenase [Candidatus Caccalectryoclostridium excrementigallinarum]